MRARLVIQSFSKNHYIGESQAKADADLGLLISGGAMREFFHSGEVWAAVATGGGSDAISVAEEYWSR
jgi:hypothetical protein